MFFASSIVYSFLWHIISHNKLFFISQVFFSFLIGVFSPIRSYLTKVVIDGAAIALKTGSSDELISAIMVLMGSISFIVIVFRFYDYAIPLLFARIRKQAGEILTQRMLYHGINFYQTHTAGTVANKVNDVIRALPTVEQKTLDGLFVYTLEISSSLFIASGVGYQFGLVFAVWVLCSIAISAIAFRYGQQYAIDAAHERSSAVGQMVETGTSITNIHMFNGYSTERKHLDSVLEKAFAAENARDWFVLKINGAQSFTFVGVLAAIFYFLLQGLATHTITAGDFGLLTMLAGSLMNRLWILAEDVRRFIEEYGIAKQGLMLLLEPFDLVDAPDAQPLQVSDGIIAFREVQFQYGTMPALFQKKSITITKHQKVGLVGPSGSGKSTFVKLIARISDIQAGTITIDNQDISCVTQESLHDAMSIIPQEPALFSRTIRENIAYAKPDATLDEVITAAKNAYAHEFIMQLPNGYETRLGQECTLSGGQRQRIAIARAFIKDAPILILDEATSQLDAITEEHIQQALEHLMVNKTTLVIAHRLSTLLHMDRILVFDSGRIIADGTHQELLQSCPLYTTLWTTQMGDFLHDGAHIT